MHSLTEIVTDVAGNKSAPTSPFVVTVDSVAPAVSSDTQTYTTTVGSHAAGSSVSGLTNDPNITYTVATADTGGTGINSVAVYDDVDGTGQHDVFLGDAALNGAGTAYVFSTSTLGQGVHRLSSDIEDNASNITATPDLPAFTLDTIAPNAPTLNIVDTGSQQTPPVTNNDTLSGVAEAGSTVSIVIDGGTATTATADASTGAYSFTPTGLSQSGHHVSVTATDAAGNASTATTGSFVYDTVSPTVTVAETTPGQHVTATNSTVPITITLSDPALNSDGSAHTVTAADFTVTGGTLSGITQSQSNPQVYTATFTNTATGNNVSDSITFNAGVIFDQAGNGNTAGSTTVTGDTQPPAAPIIIDVDGSPVNTQENGPQQVIISGVSEANSTVQVYDVVQNDNGNYSGVGSPFFFEGGGPSNRVLLGTTTTDANGHFSLTAFNLTSDVTHVLTAVASDAVGNQSTTSNAVAAAVLSTADTYNAKAVIPSATSSNLSSPVTDYFVVGPAGPSHFIHSASSDADLINAGRTRVEVINDEYTVNSTITAGASANTVVNGGQGAVITAGSGVDDFVIDLVTPGSAQIGYPGQTVPTPSVSASPLSNAQTIQHFLAGDTLDVSAVFGSGSTLQVTPTATGGEIVTVQNDVTGGTTEVKIDGAAIVASQIITRVTEVYDSTDAGQIISTYFGGSSTPSTLAGYDANGGHVFTNRYDGSGRLVEQDGFNSDGSEIVITHASDGSSTLAGFAADGHETYLNHYDASGALFEQQGFDNTGAQTVLIFTAADGSRTVNDFASGVLSLQMGFAADGHETYLNTYSSAGMLVEQDGFNSAGVKVIEIDHFANGGEASQMFDSNGSLTAQQVFDSNQTLQSMLTRTPSTGAYTNTAEVSGITLSTITGTGELVLNVPGSVTVGLTSGFGTAAVDDFIAQGQGHDLVHVLTSQAMNYAQLIGDTADNANGDAVITFDANDVLTLHGVHTAQLSASDFLFG